LRGGMLRADARRAVGRCGVVPARVRVEFIQRGDVVHEPLARFLWRRRGAVEIDLFAAAKVCLHADHVALIGDDVNQLVLPEEAADRRIALADFFPCLDGKAERRRVGKLKLAMGCAIHGEPQ
jgi:hypothetical protein